MTVTSSKRLAWNASKRVVSEANHGHNAAGASDVAAQSSEYRYIFFDAITNLQQ